MGLRLSRVGYAVLCIPIVRCYFTKKQTDLPTVSAAGETLDHTIADAYKTEADITANADSDYTTDIVLAESANQIAVALGEQDKAAAEELEDILKVSGTLK